MISVNLINQKKIKGKKRNVLYLVSLAVFGLFSLYFVGMTIYAIVGLLSTNYQISKVGAESVVISGGILKDNTRLSEYVLAKAITDKLKELDASKFDYKGYLDKLNTKLPSGTSLSNVDFSVKNLMQASVVSSNVETFSLFEKSFMDGITTDTGFGFSASLFDSVSREANGDYRTKLLLGIRK